MPQAARIVFDELVASAGWAAPRRQTLRQARLAQLLHFAQRSVPFYRQRLAPVLRRDGSIDLDHWTDIPIVRRSDLADPGMRPRDVPDGHGPTHVFTTSGSTGTPVSVLTSRLANLVTQCLGYRAQRWHNLDWSATMLTWLGDSGREAQPGLHSRGPWGPPWLPQSTGVLYSIARSAAPEVVLEAIERSRARYVMARPRTLQELALASLRAGKTLQLDKLLTFSTASPKDVRDDCFAAFGATLCGGYATKEAGLIAYDCPHGAGLHIHDDAYVVEIVDEQGRPTPRGGTGRIVVTPLFNFAQPLIRYDQGDLGILADAPCGCGLSLPLLQRIVGRTTDLFRFPDGQVMAPSIPPDYDRVLGAKYWQVAQVGPLTVEVRYVPTRGPSDRAGFVAAIHHLLRSDLSVRFVEVEDLGREQGGKFRQFVNELPAVQATRAPRPHAQS